MRQREPEHNNLYQRVTELEAKLNRANRFIKRLRQDNTELQKQLTSLQRRERQQSTLSVREIPLLPERQPSRPKKRRTEYRNLETTTRTKRVAQKRRLARVYQIRLAGLALAVAAIFFIIGLSLVRLIYRPPAAQPSPQPTATQVIQLPETPLLAPEFPDAPQTDSLPSPAPDNAEALNLVYNVTTPPDLKPSQQLQTIVDELVKMATDEGTLTSELSITLINVNSGEIAEYQQQELRYPASVLKLFWMVHLYGELAQGILSDEQIFAVDLYRMIQQSSNSASSRIIDSITGTKSGKNLEGEEYQDWLRRRLHLSEFFQKAGYEGIIVSQKTYSNISKPEGREGQMWDDPQQPIRNKISSYHAARLMYEIVTGKTISPEYSQKMVKLLARDLRPESLIDKAQYGGFDPIEGFLGKSLSGEDIDFASKAGWSSTGRHEVAFVRTRDGKTAYILSILGSDRTYANDWDLFPKMSRFVFDRMSG